MIERIEAWTIGFDLQHPVVLGELVYRRREYCVVRITDENGASGSAWALSRGAPLEQTVAGIAGLVTGKDPWASAAIWDLLYEASIPYGQRGIALRAISLIDIALWDLKGRLVGRPIHALLGTARAQVLASAGAGYYRDRRPAEEIAQELRGLVDTGVRHIKIPGGGWSPKAEEDWARLAREAVGPDVGLGIDAHWSWRDVASAFEVVRRWEDFDLAWVEDPMWPEALPAAAELRRKTTVPIAIGDELSGRWAYQQLQDTGAADLWRIDVTCVGGFTEARRIAALAAVHGVALATHIYPELHIQLATAEPGVRTVEYTLPESDIDLAYRFVEPIARPVDGVLVAPTGPGHGVSLDWPHIEAAASSHSRRLHADGA